MSKRYLFSLAIIALLLFSVQIALAEDNYEIKFVDVKSQIAANETAVYELDIINNGPNEEFFTIYSPDIGWDFKTEPSYDKNIKVEAHHTYTTRILVTPLESMPYGLYGVTANVRNVNSNTVKSRALMIEIRNLAQIYGKYLPAIRVGTIMDPEVDPREDTVIKVVLENRNKLEIGDVWVNIRSSLINEDYKTSLGALEKKTLEFKVKFDDFEKPRMDVLHATAKTEVAGRIYEFNADSFDYEIMEYGRVVEDVSETKGLLIKTKTILLKNTGNSDKKYAYQVKKPFLSGLYLSEDPNGNVVKADGKKYIEWQVSITPNMSEKIVLKYNFWPIILILIFIGMGVGAYYMIRSPVVIKKSAVVTATKDGGMWRINVQIYLKNRSKNQIKNVIIKDKISNLLEVQQEAEIGTIQPTKVLKHDKKGAIIHWDVGSLDRFEERIVTYKTKAKLSILGEIMLPHAVLSFSRGNRTIQVYSNKVLMSHK